MWQHACLPPKHCSKVTMTCPPQPSSIFIWCDGGGRLSPCSHAPLLLEQELFATSGAQVAMLLAHCPIKNTKLAIAMAGR